MVRRQSGEALAKTEAECTARCRRRVSILLGARGIKKGNLPFLPLYRRYWARNIFVLSRIGAHNKEYVLLISVESGVIGYRPKPRNCLIVSMCGLAIRPTSWTVKYKIRTRIKSQEAIWIYSRTLRGSGRPAIASMV